MTDDEMTAKVTAKISAMSDQAWMDAEQYVADIVRLGETGMPHNRRDALIIRKALSLVAGGIYERQYYRAIMDVEDN